MQTQRRRAQGIRRGFPTEEPRSEADWSFHNRYELYRDRCRKTGRLAAFTLAFAALVLFRVLEPFQRLSSELVGKAAAVSALEESHGGAVQREERLARAVRAFEAVSALQDDAPWRSTGAELAQEAARLGRAYQVIVGASAAELEKAVRAHEQAPPARIGFAESVSARFASFQWAKPPEPPLSPRKKKEAERPQLSAEELSAIEDFAEARRRLDELGLPRLSGTEAVTAPAGDPSLQSIKAALEALGIDPAHMVGLASARERDEFAFRALRARVGSEADAAIRSMLEVGRGSIVEPLRSALEDHESVLATDPEVFEAELGAWGKPYKEQGDFADRLCSDPSQGVRLTDSFGELMAGFAPAARKDGAALASDWEASKAHALGLAEELELARGSFEDVEHRRASLLPDWIASGTNPGELPSQLIQVYPALLLVLLALVAYCAFLVRESFVGMLHSYSGSAVLAEMRSTSSPWTLVRRSPLQNSLTLCLYLGSLALVWLAFERGTMLTVDWASLPSAHPWSLTARTLEAAPWFGRAAFLAAAGGIVLSLFVDDPAPRRALRRV